MLGRPAFFVRVRLSCLFGCRLAESNNKSDVKKLVLRVSRRFLQNAEAEGPGTGAMRVFPARCFAGAPSAQKEQPAFRRSIVLSGSGTVPSFVFPTGAWGLPAGKDHGMDFPADMRRFGGMRRPIALRDGLREKLCLWAGKISRRARFRRICGAAPRLRPDDRPQFFLKRQLPPEQPMRRSDLCLSGLPSGIIPHRPHAAARAFPPEFSGHMRASAQCPDASGSGLHSCLSALRQ